MSEERAPYGTPAKQPEPPDFDTIALNVVTDLEAITGTAPDPSALPLSAVKVVNAQTRQLMAVVAEQLRQVWNARGAADIAQLEAEAITMRTMPAGSFWKMLDRALRKLNR